MSLLLLTLIVLLSQTCQGIIQHITATLGNKQVFVVYDTDVANPRFLKTHETSSAIYLVGISPERTDATADRVVCKTSFATQVLIGPRGCDQPDNPDLATEAYNCAEDEEEAARNRLVLEDSFWLVSGSSACRANGGDATSCFGPLWLVDPNTNFPLDNRDITPHDLIDAQGMALITGFGPRCEGPLVTWMDIIMPTIFISNSTCADQFDITFNEGNFAPYYQDATDINANVTERDILVFARETTARHQRLSFESTEDGDQIHLYTTTHYGKLHVSIDTYDAKAWLRDGPVTVRFDSGCNATFTLIAVTNSTTLTNANGESLLALRPPRPINDLNYYYNQHPGQFYHSSECNYRVGMLDELGNLRYPFLMEGEIGGGEWVFKTPGLVGKPFHVEPDAAFLDYDIDSCDSFNPRKQPFCPYQFSAPNDSDCAVPQVPYLASTGLCFAPFLDPERIQQLEGSNEARFRDCHRQGGYVYGASRDRCFRPIQRVLCKRGWMYYHQHCYYKFDADREIGYKTTDNLAEGVCQQVHPSAQTIKAITNDVRLFLKNRFVFWKAQPGHPYRVNLGSRVCIGLDVNATTTTTNNNTNNSGEETDVSFEYSLGCDSVPAFPVCRYHVRDVPIPHQEISFSPNTIRILRDGQDGVPHVGKEMSCRCFPGWTRKDCAAASCPPPPLSPNSNNTLERFFAKCYSNGRGSCQDRNPRQCKCFEGYGPSASWSDVHSDHPCACPAVQRDQPAKFVINQQVFTTSSPDTPVVCNGAEYGSCVVQEGLNFGVCKCVERVNLDPSATEKIEKAWEGTHCTGPVPMLPSDLRLMNGDMVERYCNGRGTVCPSGERLDEQRLDETSYTSLGKAVCLERSVNRTTYSGLSARLKSGCVCDDGWAGDACTCPVPKNVLHPLLTPVADTTTISSRAYASLRTRNRVLRVVNADTATCNVILVEIQDRPNDPFYRCTPLAVPRDRDTVEWLCPDSAGPVTKVYVETSEPNVLYCDIKAYAETYEPCGEHALPWAGSFFRNEFYRSYTTYQLPQSSQYAPHGCTLTECMCMAGFTGPLCSMGVSAIRMDWDQMGYHQDVCGMTTLPVRGSMSDRGCTCHRIEGVFGEARFTGPACEQVMVNVQGNWLPCSGRGKNIPAKFPLGRCEYDMEDAKGDPLDRPFFGVNPSVDDATTFTFRVMEPINGTGDDVDQVGSVLTLNGEFWELFPGTVYYASPVQPARNQTYITFCNQAYSVPVNVSYDCVQGNICGTNGTVQPPRRVQVLAEFWKMSYTCDPYGQNCTDITLKTTKAIHATTHYERCALHQANGELNYTAIPDDYECMYRITSWEPIEGNEEALEAGFYANSSFVCGQVARIDTVSYRERSYALGLFDCSNPIDRILADLSVALGLASINQCEQGSKIRDHSDVLGAWYGLFEGFISGLRFHHDRMWSDDEVQFLASLLNNEVCVAEENDNLYIHEAFDGRVLDDISRTWTNDVEPETDVNATAVLPGSTEFLDTQLVVESASPYRVHYVSVIPVLPDQYIRKLYITVSLEGLQSLRVYGPTGRLCYTTFTQGAFEVNTTIFEVDCSFGLGERDNGFLPAEMEWDALVRIRDEAQNNWTLANETIAAYYSQWSNQIRLVWTHREYETFSLWGESFRAEDIRILSRRTTYTGLFGRLKQQILVDYEFPPHTVYRESCLRRPRTRLRAFNATRDLQYLRDLHLTHLSARRCSSTWQCKRFARNPTAYQCVFDQSYARMWRGGDPAFAAEPFIGDEGGCLCTEGFSDSQFHCSSCVHGYGPNDPIEWTRFREQAEVMANLTGQPVQTLPSDTYCMYPYDPLSLRENKICGGRGDVVEDTFTSNVTIRVFSSTNETRRCLQLRVLSSYNSSAMSELLDLITDDGNDHDLRVIRYRGTWSTITVLSDDIFVNHTTTLGEVQQVDPRTLSGVIGDDSARQTIEMQCIPIDWSDTHAMMPLEGIDEITNSRQSFFLSKVQFSIQ